MNAQYKKIYSYGDYHKDWALVKTDSGNYGLIDQNKKQIVAPIYSKIGKFGEIKKDLALVENYPHDFGMFNTDGKEIMPTTYTLNDIKAKYR